MRKCLLLAFVAVLWGLSHQGFGAEGAARIDINKATVAELDTLPGIGPVIAARIVEFRTKNGPFKRPEDLMNVRGIGEKKFLKLKERIAVSAPQPPAPPRPAAATRATRKK
jgi:competence protein ComEA